LSQRTRNIAIIVGVVALMVLSRFLFGLPDIPEISLAPEVIARPFGFFPFTNSLLLTLIVDVVLIGLVIFGMRRRAEVPRGLQNVLEYAVELIHGLGESIDRRNIARFFTLAASIFFFVFLSNFLALVPGVGSIGRCLTHEAAVVNPEPEEEEAASEESTTGGRPLDTCYGQTDEEGHKLYLIPLLRAPSADLNMTLGLALIVFVATQYHGFKALGPGYLGKFFNFKGGLMGLFVGLIEFISEFVRIVSFMFRLFGNIFAGEVVLLVMAFLIPWLLPSVFYAYEMFVAFIQAFIFAILTMVFISLATEHHGGHDEIAEGHDTPHVAPTTGGSARVYES
jgi:F-type H+-transporting ATPase subunit a